MIRIHLFRKCKNCFLKLYICVCVRAGVRWVSGDKEGKIATKGAIQTTGFLYIFISDITVKKPDKDRKSLTAFDYPRKGGVSSP